jgi:acetoin utilization protein AcuC
MAKARSGELAPTSTTDGKDPSFVPWEGGPGGLDEALDVAVVATREAVFPHWGLDPMVAQG